jgi:uncharacterized oligopeptide transporter (OPT) family protein
MAGIISLARSLPTIIHGLKGGLADLRGGTGLNGDVPRTDRDLSMKWVVVGVIALIAAIMLFPKLGLSVFQHPVVSFFGAILIILLGFLFVTVSSRLTGEVGSSSNPISGMTVATLLITCLAFLLLGWTAADPYFVTALSIGGIVCIAASNGGTTSQDLKTGFWVGATPRHPCRRPRIGARFGFTVDLFEWLTYLLSKGRSHVGRRPGYGNRRQALPRERSAQIRTCQR